MGRSRTSRSRSDRPSEEPAVVRAGTALPTLRGGAVPERVLRAGLAGVQRSAGNAAAAAQVQRAFEDGGSAGPLPSTPVELGAGGASPAPMAVNEFGEIDVGVTSDAVPHLFRNRGKRGVGLVNWAGGPGGAGQQAVGSITLVAPQYDSAAPKRAGGPGRAWVRSGTGKATVTRSYLGVQPGANATYWFTGRACRRADVHERLHVTSSRTIHDANIRPLERRVAARKGKRKALAVGATAAEALIALQAQVNWNTAVTAFSNADTTANTPMGTTDTTDMASPTFIRDYGPRAVRGANYAHYIDTPPGP